MVTVSKNLELAVEKLNQARKEYKTTRSTYSLIVNSSQIVDDLERLFFKAVNTEFSEAVRKTGSKATQFYQKLTSEISLEDLQILAKHGISDADWLIAGQIAEETSEKLNSPNEKIRYEAWSRYIYHLERGAIVYDMAESTAKRMCVLANDFAEGPYPDYQKAIMYYETAAELGSDYDAGEAHFYLWDIYFNLLDNKRRAKKHLLKAVDLNFPDALAAYGRAHLGDWLVKEDERKAFELINKSSKLGSDLGKELLAQCYEMAWGTKKNVAKAFKIRMDLSENYSGNLCCALAIHHLDGIGTAKDVKEGKRLLRKAMKYRSSQAYFKAAELIWQADDFYNNKKKQKQRFEILKAGSELDDIWPQVLTELGRCYFYGEGTKKNSKKAKLCFQPLCDDSIFKNEAEIYLKALEEADHVSALDRNLAEA